MSRWRVKLAAALAAAGLLAGMTLPAGAAEDTVRQYETSQPVTSVVADVENAVLVIQKGTGSTIQVDSDAEARGEYAYDFDLKDGVLTVRVEATEGEKLKIDPGKPVHLKVIDATVSGNVVVWDNQITITLPEAVYDRIEGKTHNGSITASGVEAENLTLDAGNGNVTLENTRGVKVHAKAGNGNIRLDHPYGLDYDLTAQNGNITGTLAGTKADYRLKVEAKNGDSNLEDQPGTGVASATMKAQNGDVKVKFTG